MKGLCPIRAENNERNLSRGCPAHPLQRLAKVQPKCWHGREAWINRKWTWALREGSKRRWDYSLTTSHIQLKPPTAWRICFFLCQQRQSSLWLTWVLHNKPKISIGTIHIDKNIFVLKKWRTKNITILRGNRPMRNGEWIKIFTCFHLVAVHYFKENKALRHSFLDKQSLMNFHGKQV